MEIQAFVGKVNFYSLVNEFSEVGPVFQVPRATVNLVDDDSSTFAFIKQLEHFVKDRPAPFGSRLSLLKPFADLQLVPLRIALDSVALFLKRNSFFALFSR